MPVNNTCGGCRHCSQSGYCDIKEKTVNPDSSACSEFEER